MISDNKEKYANHPCVLTDFSLKKRIDFILNIVFLISLLKTQSFLIR